MITDQNLTTYVPNVISNTTKILNQKKLLSMGGDKKPSHPKMQTLYNKRQPSGKHERFISGSYILSYDELRKKNLGDLNYLPITGNQMNLHGES